MCLSLGYALGKDLKELGEMDLDELALWAAWLDEYDPETRGDWRAGMIASTIANAHSRRGKWKPKDFMPHYRKQSKPQNAAEAERMIEAWCANVGQVNRSDA